MILSELIKNLKSLSTQGSTSRIVTGLSHDARRVQAGNIFFDLGENHREDQFPVQDAIAKGAVVIISAREIVPNERVTLVRAADIRRTMAEMAAKFYGEPSRELSVIGVAGMHAQQNVAYILRQILESGGIKTALVGSIRTQIGERMLPGKSTLPEAIELQHLMAQMVRSGCKACVIELDQEALAKQKLGSSHFDALVVTRLGGNEASMEPELSSFLQTLPQAEKKISVVINMDETNAEAFAARPTACEVELTYGFSERAAVRATAVEFTKTGATFRLHMRGSSLKRETRLAGRQNVYNILAAAGASSVLDLPMGVIGSAIRKLKSTPGNLQKVESNYPFQVFVDSARTPAAMTQALKDLREIGGRGLNRLIVVFGCTAKSSSRDRKQMGSIASREADLSIITSDNPGSTNPQVICDDIMAGFENGRELQVELDRAEAIQHAIKIAESGDIILIAGKGEQAYQELAHTIAPFDDCEQAREALELLELLKPSAPNSSRMFSAQTT